jgi:hypothetical protein
MRLQPGKARSSLFTGEVLKADLDALHRQRHTITQACRGLTGERGTADVPLAETRLRRVSRCRCPPGGLPLRFRLGKLGRVVDAELSGALVTYLRGAGLPYPYPSTELDAVVRIVGADAAERLRPVLDQLIAEAVSRPVDWNRHTLPSASRLVRDGMAGRHPELSREAVAALAWAFDHSHF